MTAPRIYLSCIVHAQLSVWRKHVVVTRKKFFVTRCQSKNRVTVSGYFHPYQKPKFAVIRVSVRKKYWISIENSFFSI